MLAVLSGRRGRRPRTRRSAPLFSGLYLLAVGVLSGADTFTSEDYAVYSAALANIRYSHADRRLAVVIARDTIDIHGLRVPTEDCSSLAVDLRRRMEDVLTVNHGLPVSGSRTLSDKKLVIGRPYMFVDSRQADEWIRRRFSPKIPAEPPVPEIADSFPGTSDLVRLSNILSNANKTVALVQISVTCGSLCLSSQWYFVEKTQGAWRVLATPGCGTIS
jgi:hypothetical protein